MNSKPRRYCSLAALTLSFALMGGLIGCAPGQPTVASVDETRIINATTREPGSWLTHGQTYKEQRFSPS